MSFGEYIKTKRLQKGLTLRGFCNKYSYDTAYISRLETNKLLPPIDQAKLETLASALSIKKDSTDWFTFQDLAANAHNDLSADIKSDASEIISQLPTFLRTRDNKKINKDKVKELLNFLTQNA